MPPILYKKAQDGKLQMWQITVTDNQIITTFGDEGGKLQTTTDTIWTGKNLGKKNATTPDEQARAEAQAKWEKQIKRKGYVEDRARALNSETDAEGGLVPMLAHKFSEQGHKIQYPALVQPKLDGSRCIAIIDDGVCTLWSRTRKLITSVPHINASLEKIFPAGYYEIDGELYSHSHHDQFEQLMSLIRSETPKPGHEIVQYHIYDYPSHGGTNSARNDSLQAIFKTHGNPYIILVETHTVNNEDELMTKFDYFLSLGYEGAMIRNSKGLYENKRSYNLQKVKEFLDDEFDIVGIEEGRGKLQGHVGSFICITKNKVRFNAKAKGELDNLKKYFEDHSLWQGKQLTVQYQGITNKSGVPRFPVGLRIRQD